MYTSTNRKEFINEMLKSGYSTKWTDTRKYITFTDKAGRTIRDKNLADTYGLSSLSKEGLEEVFASNIRYRADKKAEVERKKQESTAKAEAERQKLIEQQRESVPEQPPPAVETAQEETELESAPKRHSGKLNTFIKKGKDAAVKLFSNKTKDESSLITAVEQPAPTPQVVPEELESAAETVSAPKHPVQPMSPPPPAQPTFPPKEIKTEKVAAVTPTISVASTPISRRLSPEEKVKLLFEQNPPKASSVAGELDVERYNCNNILVVPMPQPSPQVNDSEYDE
jgi:hypothetical protein